jgi:hypothetical protein
MGPQLRGGLFIHPDGLSGGTQGDVDRGNLPQRGFYVSGLPDQQQLVVREPTCGGEDTGDDLPGGVVSAEGVYRDAHGRASPVTRLDVLHGDHRAALVEAALGTDPVRYVGLTAIRALDEARARDRMVGPALIPARA